MGFHLWKGEEALETAKYNIMLNLGAALLIFWLITKGA
jgi:hypothetical protein